MKAAFLYNFAKFVEWPAETFSTPKSPIVCCILGESPFTAALERAASGRPIEDHTFLVRRIAEPRQAAGCQILFVSSAEHRRAHTILKEVPNSGLLTVGDADNFIADGGIAVFRLVDNRIRIQVNAKAAERGRLRISPKLLRIAEIVGN